MTVISWDDDIIGGKAHVKGTRVSVKQIVEMNQIKGMCSTKIAEVLPTIKQNEAEDLVKLGGIMNVTKN